MSHHPEPPPEDLSTILLEGERELVWLDIAFAVAFVLACFALIAVLVVEVGR